MSLFLLTVFMLIASLGVHLVIWRVRLPKRHSSSLVVIFSVVPVVVLALGGSRLVSSPWDALLLFLAYVPAALTYICLYSLIENQSPTVALVEAIREGGEQLTVDELRARMSHAPALTIRLDSMERSGVIRRSDGHYEIADKWVWLVRSLTLVALVLRVREGG